MLFWLLQFAADAGTGSKAAKKCWVQKNLENGGTVARACYNNLYQYQITLTSWLYLLGRSQVLPPVVEREFAAMKLVIDFFICYLIVREALRICYGQAGFKVDDVSWGDGRGAQRLPLADFRRLCLSRNPIVEAFKDVLDSSLIEVCQRMQLHNVLPVLDPINKDMAKHYVAIWAVIRMTDEDLVTSRLKLLLTIFPALRGRKASLAQWFAQSRTIFSDLKSVLSFLENFEADQSGKSCIRLVGDQRTAETRTGKNLHPKVEILSIIWDHFLDCTRTS